jgi:ABC-type multidrug transport system fused ATPase/permease subunit
MGHGNILERGSHESLLQQKGAYYNLYTAVEKVAMA